MIKQRTDPKTWLTITVDGNVIEQHIDQFPDGSFRWNLLDLPEAFDKVNVLITLKTTLPEAIMAVYQALSALDAVYIVSEVTLKVQTLPDQRADRAEKKGMSIPARATAAMLAGTGVDSIIIYDAHSPVIVDYLKRYFMGYLVHVPAVSLFASKMEDRRTPTHIVAVDKGSIQRAETVAAEFDASVIYMDKVRENGNVVGHEILSWNKQAPEHDSIIWIVDDLCDGGATFISAADVIFDRFEYEELNLFVTHGLFSKGKEELSRHFDNVVAHFDYSEGN